MRTALITANFGGVDTKKEIPPQSVDCEIKYVDDSYRLPMCGLSNRMKGKYVKMHMHQLYPGFTNYIWVDSSIEILSPDFVKFWIEPPYEFSTIVHPQRRTIMQEAQFIEKEIQNGNEYLKARYEGQPLIRQVQHYVEKYPKILENQLYAMGIFSYKSSGLNMTLMSFWWDEIIKWGTSDQIAFIGAYRAVYMQKEFFREVNYRLPEFLENDMYKFVPHI